MINVLKLKARLREKNMTQEDIAKALSVNPSTLNKKINDEAGECITIAEAERMREVLDIPKEDMMLYFFN